jgi:hypothetical protein
MTVRLVVTTLAVFLVAFPGIVLGQDQSLQDVRNNLREGDRVRIVDITRTPTVGRLDSLGPGSFVLKARGKTVTIPDNRVYLIQVPRREGDGVLIGMGIGAAAGLIFARLDCRDSSEHRDCVNAASIYLGGSMAVVGALVDHGFKRYTTVFDRTVAGNTIRIAPLFGARRRGLALMVSF